MSDVAAARPPREKAFFGHPKGLQTLFFTEMWERFSYYGMRAFLTIYIATEVAKGGLGESPATAGIYYALYGSTIYLVSLPGGWIADRFIGQRMAVLIGGIIIMFGHITLALPTHDAFLPGLGLIVLGTGFLKPNVSTIVGQLYDKSDPRRDAGYTIYYMGINVGALVAPIACGFLAQSSTFRTFLANQGIDPNASWHFGFGAAAIGMALGVVQFVHGWKYLGDAGAKPAPRTGSASAPMPAAAWIIAAIGTALIVGASWWIFHDGGLNKGTIADAFGVGLAVLSVVVFIIMHQYVAIGDDERRRVRAMMVLFLGCLSFFGLFEQAGSTLSFFAEQRVHRTLVGIDFPSSYYQFINAAFVILLGPVFAALWIALQRKGKEPTPVTKFSVGMVLISLSFVVLLPALLGPIAAGHKTTGLWLFAVYFFATTGELCISPVGLSTMNKLAPERLAGFVMGIWFLATSVGYYLAGRAEEKLGKLADKLEIGPAITTVAADGTVSQHHFAGIFYLLIVFSLVVAAILYALAGPVKRMLAQGNLPVAKARK